MILPAYFARLAARGQATVGFVPVSNSRTVTRGGRLGWKVPRPGKGTTYRTNPWAPQTGSCEPLRSSIGRRVATVGGIVIEAHHRTRLGTLLEETTETLQLVRATGCKTRAEFAREWMRHTDRGWPPTEEELCDRCGGRNEITEEWTNPITDVSYTTVEECPKCDEVGVMHVELFPPDEEILERFRRHHAHREVYVVYFTLDRTEHLRLLSPSGRPRGDDLGYTENPNDAMPDAGEAVPLGFQEALSRDASFRDQTGRRDRGEGRQQRDKRRYERRRAA